jgi:hypothetical protein
LRENDVNREEAICALLLLKRWSGTKETEVATQEDGVCTILASLLTDQTGVV